MMNWFNGGRMNQSFVGYYYTCNKFGHKANQYRSRVNGGQTNQKNVVCYNCNKPRHISRVCRSKGGKQFDPIMKNMKQ